MTDRAVHLSDAPPSLRFRSERVARRAPAIEVRFVPADAFTDPTRRVLGEVPPGTVLAAGDALRLPRGELRGLEPGGGRHAWAVEQAREWSGHA